VTLRLRLLLSVVAIVAAGLVISDLVTYNALRSDLITRVDQQLELAAYPVTRALLSSSGIGPRLPGAPPTGTTPAGGGSTSTAPRSRGSFRSRAGSDRIFLNGGSTPAGSARGVLVPPGTYGQLRGANGTVEAHLFFSYGGKTPAAPSIASRLPGAGLSSTSDLYFSTSSTGPNAVDYRAVAKPLIGGGVMVIAVPLTDEESTLSQLLLIEVIVSAVLLLGLGILAWVMVRRDLRPLEEMTETAGTIAGGDLSSRVPEMTGGAEMAQLGRSFNSMLDEIERAFAQRAASEERLRRFLADASHELRTPLTSILGYAELFDLGVRDRPEDLAASMHHIRDEASRMGTLVDDLFLLAQLDRERPLALERLELAELVQLSVASFVVTAPDRPVTVVAGTPVWVEGDRSRLRQVVDNLLVNVQRHTPPGSAVDVSVRLEGQTAVLAVHDNGPGIDPAEAARIFEPFYRSDPSRSRRSGGAGLGLAIVAAIVNAHQGRVSVGPGPGATFIVRLPAVAAPSAAVNGIGDDSDSHDRPPYPGGPSGAIGSGASTKAGPLEDVAGVASTAGTPDSGSARR
jgi:two-component system OmpR family sensor kinase